MAHVKALLIKGIMTFIGLWMVLSLGYEFTVLNVFWITLILGAVSYAIGDLFIYPKTSNTIATAADLGVTFIVVWLLAMAFTGIGAGTSAVAAIISAVVIALGEYIFHFYVAKKNIAANDKLRANYSN